MITTARSAYSPDFHDRFGSLEDAKAFLDRYFPSYNTAHRTDGSAMLTPAMVHNGRRHARRRAIDYLRIAVDDAQLVRLHADFVLTVIVRVISDPEVVVRKQALTVAPALAGFAVVETWAGLRPGSADRRPYLGRTPLKGSVSFRDRLARCESWCFHEGQIAIMLFLSPSQDGRVGGPVAARRADHGLVRLRRFADKSRK